MLFNKKLRFIISSILVSTALPSFAAGLALSQIGTAESVATAGVAGVTNNRDASSTITNPAGLSGIEDSSFVFGFQYLNVNTEFENRSDENVTASKSMPGLHLSYANRLDEQWVIGFAMHSTGGLGLEYDNGVIGGEKIDSNLIGFVNLTASTSYQLNNQLSLGASLVGQVAVLETNLYSNTSDDATLSGSNIAPTFNLAAMYQVTDITNLGITYHHKAEHDLDLSRNNSADSTVEVNWPTMVELGLQHDFDDKLSMMLSASWQQWSDFSDKYDDTYGAGVALSYQLNDWTIQTGVSVDSSPVSAENRDPLLPLAQQWRVGVGGSKTLSNGMILGIAYQYQSLGDAEIDNTISGHYSENEVHFITTSLSF